MNDIKAFCILLNKSGLPKLSELLKNASSEVDMSSQYGKYLHSVISTFNLLVSPHNFDEVEKYVKGHQEILVKCAKKLYPDDENAPEIVAVCTRILREEKNEDSKEDVDQKLLQSLLNLSKLLPEADKYIKEAAACYEHSLLRSSVNMSWQLFVFALFKRIEIYGLPSFVQKAKQKKILKDTIEYPHDLNKIKDIDLIQLCHECGFYDQNVRNDLQTNDKLRNSCSHVAFNEISRQKVEAFLIDIFSCINDLLGVGNSSEIIADDNLILFSSYDEEEFSRKYTQLNSRQESDLLKQCFYYLSKGTIMGEEGVKKSERVLKQLLTLGNAASKTAKIKLLVSQSAKYNFFPEFIKNILPLFFKNPSFERILGNDINVRNDIINLYANSSSFDEAKRRKYLPFYILEYINDEERGRLIDSVLNNSQINGSWHSRHQELLNRLNYNNNPINIEEIPF